MFKYSLAYIWKFVESDDKIRVMWNAGDVVLLGMWHVGFVRYLGCGMLMMWDVGNVGYPGCEIGDVGCWE